MDSNLNNYDFDHLLYLRLFEGCNLHCDHCFIPANPKKLSIPALTQYLEDFSRTIPSDSKVLVQWHGGEPTALGTEYFRKALECFNNIDSEITWSHGIQTNLMTYNEEWRDIYKEYFDSNIGVSWDYKIRKLKGSNSDFEDKFWKNMDQLVSDGIDPYLIVTSTKLFFNKFRNPIDFFQFLIDRDIKKAHIERLTRTGYARSSWNEIGITNLEYSRYMSRFALAYNHYRNKHREHRQELNLSPFDGLEESVDRLKSGSSGGYGCLSGKCDTRFHTIDSNGYKFGCTALNSEVDNKNAVEFIEITDLLEQRKERQVSCEGCKFITICSSGCIATTKIDESGECSGGYNLFETIYSLNSNF